MDISTEEAMTMVSAMEWYLKNHPRCPASKSELRHISAAIEKLKEMYMYKKVEVLLNNYLTENGDYYVNSY